MTADPLPTHQRLTTALPADNSKKSGRDSAHPAVLVLSIAQSTRSIGVDCAIGRFAHRVTAASSGDNSKKPSADWR
jgi:hypothetical protein